MGFFSLFWFKCKHYEVTDSILAIVSVFILFVLYNSQTFSCT